MCEKDVLSEVLTASEVAELYGFAEPTVRQAINRGSIRARKSAGTWLVAKSDIEAYWGQPPAFPSLEEFDGCFYANGDNGSYYYLTLKSGEWLIIDNVSGEHETNATALEAIKYERWREWISRDEIWDVVGKLPDVPHEELEGLSLFEEGWIWEHVGRPSPQ